MATTTKKATVLRPRHVIWASMWLTVFVMGGIAQTHLRFSERDLEIQARRAQEELVSLRDDLADLEAEVETLRGGPVIRERAIGELGLIPAPPTEIYRLEADEIDWAKFASADEDAPAPRRHLIEDPAWMRWISQSGWAEAREAWTP